MARPGRAHTRGHEGHDTGGVRHEGKEGGNTVDQPEHGIWPSARPLHRLTMGMAQGTVEVVENLQREGPDQTPEERQVFVTQI